MAVISDLVNHWLRLLLAILVTVIDIDRLLLVLRSIIFVEHKQDFAEDERIGEWSEVIEQDLIEII